MHRGNFKKEVVSALVCYLRGAEPFGGLGIKALPKSYAWPRKNIRNPETKELEDFLTAPKRFFSKSFRIRDFRSNVELKKAARAAWRETEEKYEFAVWIVSDWGGIKKSDSIQKRFRRT